MIVVKNVGCMLSKFYLGGSNLSSFAESTLIEIGF